MKLNFISRFLFYHFQAGSTPNNTPATRQIIFSQSAMIVKQSGEFR